MIKFIILFSCFHFLCNSFAAAEIAEWQHEIDESLKRNIVFASWRYADQDINKVEPPLVTSSEEFLVRRFYPSKQEMKAFRQLPSTLTTANEGLGITAGKRGYRYDKWGSEKDLRWEVPATHPGQDRNNCINMTLLASTGNIYSFYDSFRQIDRAHYVLFGKEAFIHPNGVVGIAGGYFMGQENCETRWDQAKSWYSGCKEALKKFGLTWGDLWKDNDEESNSQALPAASQCTDHSHSDIPTLPGANFTITRHTKVFVMPALWDFNYHHFVADSLARIVRYYSYLKKHTDVRIHIRAFEDYDTLEYQHDAEGRARVKVMKQRLFELMGISFDRIVSGPILAEQVIIPRCLRCSYALSNPIELRVLSRILLFQMRTYLSHHAEQVPAIATLSSTSPTILNNEKKPVMIILQRADRAADRMWDANMFQQIINAFATAYPTHQIIPVSSKQQQSPCLACELYLYSQADVLVGMHGAGLTNMMFLPPDALVIEIVGVTMDVNMPVCGYYGPYAAIFGHHHYIDAFLIEAGEHLNATRVANESAKFYTFLRNHTIAQRKDHTIEIFNGTKGYPCRP